MDRSFTGDVHCVSFWLLHRAIHVFADAIWKWKKRWQWFCDWDAVEKTANGRIGWLQRWTGSGRDIAAVFFNKVEERQGCRGWTYVSGKSTSPVLILLCKANMYSSINGHCRWSRGKTVRNTQLREIPAPNETAWLDGRLSNRTAAFGGPDERKKNEKMCRLAFPKMKQ